VVPTDAINVAGAMALLSRMRESLPLAARAIERDEVAVAALAHSVVQVFNACAAITKDAQENPLPIAPLPRRDARDRANVYARGGRIEVDNFSALDSFLAEIHGLEECWRIRRCKLEECGRFFYASREDAVCCCRTHAAHRRVNLSRIKQREKRGQYELNRGARLVALGLPRALARKRMRGSKP